MTSESATRTKIYFETASANKSQPCSTKSGIFGWTHFRTGVFAKTCEIMRDKQTEKKNNNKSANTHRHDQ